MTDTALDPNVSGKQHPVVPPHDLRRFPRHNVRSPLLGIPILPDGSPDWEHRRVGYSVDLSQG